MRHYLLMFCFVLILLGQLAPMTLMRETWDPWYIEYTTALGMLSFFVFSPALLGTAILGQTALLGQEGLSIAHWVFNIVWLIVLCNLVSRVSFSSCRSSLQHPSTKKGS